MGVSAITVYDFAVLIISYLDSIESEFKQRKYVENKMFLIVYANDREHWKLKAQIFWLKDSISTYVATLDDAKLFRLQLQPYKIIKLGLVLTVKWKYTVT